MRDPTDDQLALAAKEGDHQAFETLFRRHKGSTFSQVRKMFRCREDAEDVFMIVWAKVYVRLHSYAGKSPFEHWLKRVATNAALDELRRLCRHGQAVNLDAVDCLSASIRDPGVSVECHAAGRHNAAAFLNDELTDMEFHCAVLLYLGWEARDIAALWGVPEDKVSRMRRGLKLKATAYFNLKKNSATGQIFRIGESDNAG